MPYTGGGGKPQPGAICWGPTAEARRSWIFLIHESMTFMDSTTVRCGEAPWVARPVPAHVPTRSAGSWLEAGPSSASPSRACLAHCHCSSHPFSGRICAFALHCISLRACGSAHHMSHSATRPRYLALAPEHFVAGCGLLPSVCHIMITTTSSTLHDSFPCFHNIS